MTDQECLQAIIVICLATTDNLKTQIIIIMRIGFNWEHWEHGIRDIGIDYWLASRGVNSNSSDTRFLIRFVINNGQLSGFDINYVYSYGGVAADSATLGLRPVFTLKPGLKIIGGNGTSSSPYTLGT